MNKNGKLIWVINRGKVIKWNLDGSPNIMFGTIFDDTNRKKEEEEKLKLTMAIEQSTVTIIMTDPNGKIEYINPAFEKSTGYSLNEVIEKNKNFLENGLNSEEVINDIKKTIRSGDTWEGELVNEKKDGTIYYEEARI